MIKDTKTKLGTLEALHFLSAMVLLLTFFMPWVSWGGTLVKGSDLATGDFFRISASQFKLDNPFPQLSFSFYAFWLVPALAVVSAAFVALKRKTVPFSYIAGAAALSLFSIYYLFTGVLVDLGVGKSVVSMLKPAAWIHMLAAALLIITAIPFKNWLPKLAWLLIGPVIAYAGFKFIEKKTMAETFAATEDVKADFTLDAGSLIKEFLQNDTAARNKYLEKVLVVNGKITKLELLADSSSTVSFADSTGSYAIFSLEKEQYKKIKELKDGDSVSMKAVCSGSMYSEILGSTAITFKRATFNSDK